MRTSIADEARRRVLVLDGPTGTELIRRGYAPEPVLWTAAAADRTPALLRAVHADYVAAGADIVTANTFRTTAYAAALAGTDRATARRWLRAAVEAARAARPRFVAGSLAPLGDCYVPSEAPGDDILSSAHSETATWLAEAGCDLALCETMGTAREAEAAVRAAVAAGLEAWVGLLPGEDGLRLLGGDELLAAARRALGAGAAAVLLNCVHGDVIERALGALGPLLREGVVLGAYPNAARMHFAEGRPAWTPDGRSEAERAAALGARAHRWRLRGARVLGACCGYTPAAIAAISAAARA